MSAWIEILAADRVSDGAGGWLKPGARVACTEEQAASLAANGFAATVDGPAVETPPAAPAVQHDDAAAALDALDGEGGEKQPPRPPRRRRGE